MRFTSWLLAALLWGGVAQGQMLQSIVNAKAASAAAPLTFTTLANGTVGGAAIAGSGAYTGTAPTSISTATWGGGCSGSSTVTGFSAGGLAWSANFSVPASAGTGCTISITDNRSDTATSPGVTISAAYAGPGDVVAFTHWWGLRAYNNAYATGSNNAVQISPNSGTNIGSLKSIVILSNGNLDMATANAWAGTDVTCTGGTATSSTTLALTGCSGTPHVQDTFIGTTSSGSYTLPAWITAVGSFAAGAGTVTMNQSVTVGFSAVTFQNSMSVATMVDQPGGGATISFFTNGPQLVPTCLNGATVPCMLNFGNTQGLQGTITALSAPFTLSTVVQRVSALGSGEGYAVTGYGGGSGNGIISIDESGHPNAFRLYCGGDINVSATDDILHSANGVCNSSGNTSILNVDGTTSTATISSASTGTVAAVTAGTSATTPIFGYEGEAGAIAGDQTSHLTALCHNQRLYYGTPGTC
jgi:hypothetical protein